MDPRLNLPIFLHLHQMTFKRTARDAARKAEKMGEDIGDRIERGLKNSEPRIRRAANRAADQSVAYARRLRALDRAQKSHLDTWDQVVELEERSNDVRERSKKTARSLGVVEREIAASRKEVAKRTREVEAREDALQKKRQAGGRQRARRAEIRQAEENLKLSKAELADEVDHLNKSLERESELNDALKRDATELESLDKRLRHSRDKLTRANDDLLRSNEEIEKSNRRLEESSRRLAKAEEDAERRRTRRKKGKTAGVVGNMLTDLPGVPSGPAGAYIGGAMLLTLASAGEAVVTASQAIALLPAVATAAAAGIGTLAIGFSGFGDAIKEMGDPDKFATALQSLAPAAQQAALEIQYLTQGPLAELKSAVQERLFEGVAEQFRNVTNELLPEFSTLTDGVAGAFNGMFSNFTGELIAPDSQESIGRIVNDIVVGFQKAAPAVTHFTDAFLRITEVGASFLPEIGQGITNMAETFANFIKEAQANGSLEEFIRKGMKATQELGNMIGKVGKWIYQTFGNKSPEEFRAMLDAVGNTLGAIIQMIQGLASLINGLISTAQPFVDVIGGWETAVQLVAAAFIGIKFAGVIAHLREITGLFGGAGTAATKSGRTIAAALSPQALGLTALIITVGNLIDKIRETNAVMAEGAAAQEAMAAAPTNAAANQIQQDFYKRHGLDSTKPPKPGSMAEQWALEQIKEQDARNGIKDMPGFRPPERPLPSDAGLQNQRGIPRPRKKEEPANAGLPPWSPHAVPLPSEDEKKGRKPSEKDRKDAWLATIDPNSFMPDINGMLPPGMPGPGQPKGGKGPGGFNVDPRAVFDAEQKVIREAQDLRDARIDLAYMEQDGVSTQYDILKAKEKVQEQETQFYNAQLDLIEAQQGKWKKADNALSKFGADIDRDFGISKGLGGIAENLVKMVGAMAMAPMNAQLSQIRAARPNEGSGLLGILAAQGAFGDFFLPAQDDPGSSPGSTYSPTTASPSGKGGYSYSQPATAPAVTAKPGQSARGFAHEVMMPYWKQRGLTVGDHAADKFGEHQNGALDIMVPSIAEGQKVLAEVLADPNVYGAIFNRTSYGYGNGPGGKPMPDRGSPTQNHEDHVHAWYKPGNSNNINPNGTPVAVPVTPGSSSANPALPASGGPVPVMVMNWPATGAAPAVAAPAAPGVPGAPPATPGQAPGTPGAPAPSSAHGPGSGNGAIPGLGNVPQAGAPQFGTPGPQPQLAPSAGPAQYAPPGQGGGWSPAGGGLEVGGGLMGAAAGAASMGADMFAPGSGAAVQMAMELGKRSVQYAGEMVGHSVGGLVETFTLGGGTGEGFDLMGSIPGRMVSGFAGAGASMGNLAGATEDPYSQQGDQNQQGQQGQNGQPAQAAPMVNIENYNRQPDQSDVASAKAIARKFNAGQSGTPR